MVSLCPARSPRLRSLVACGSLLVVVGCGGGDGGSGDPCKPDDADGVVGGKYTFDVTIDDTAFTPMILKAQNTAAITLNLHNTGDAPHGFSVGCIKTPNDNGCATKSCFPDGATVDPLDPGADATLKFTVPLVEGIYPITSSADGDTATAQFVVQ